MSRRDFQIQIQVGCRGERVTPAQATDACRRCVFTLESMFLLLTLLDPQKLGRESEEYAGEDLAMAFRNFGELGMAIIAEAAGLLDLAETAVSAETAGERSAT